MDEAEGKYFGERAYRAFDRPDLEPGTYTKVNVGADRTPEPSLPGPTNGGGLRGPEGLGCRPVGA